jgi:FkbM family methyltransferase
VNSVWLGSYERIMLTRVQAELRAGDVFYDVGAHAGIYSLAAARATGAGGTVVAVEPNQINAAHFARHMALNSVDSVRLIEAAASDASGVATFSSGPTDYEGRLNPTGDITVPTVRLDDLEPAPDVIKIDVEGHEAAVLRGAGRILHVDRPVIFIAVHNDGARSQCLEILEANEYDVEWLDPGELLARPRKLAARLR